MEKLIYIVRLQGGSRIRPKREKMIIRASSKEAAIEGAKNRSLSFRSGKCFGIACEADPLLDLGCKTKEEVLAEFKQMRYQITK